MRLSKKEQTLYHRLINQTHLPLFVDAPLETRTASITPTPWKAATPFKKSNRLDPHLLAKELFLEMQGSKPLEDEFSLKSDAFFIRGFRYLYETLHQADPNSALYHQLKQKVELARPSSPDPQKAFSCFS